MESCRYGGFDDLVDIPFFFFSNSHILIKSCSIGWWLTRKINILIDQWLSLFFLRLTFVCCHLIEADQPIRPLRPNQQAQSAGKAQHSDHWSMNNGLPSAHCLHSACLARVSLKMHPAANLPRDWLICEPLKEVLLSINLVRLQCDLLKKDEIFITILHADWATQQLVHAYQTFVLTNSGNGWKCCHRHTPCCDESCYVHEWHIQHHRVEWYLSF